jgi:hypothetical protein
MSERFVDRGDKKSLIKSCPDFKLRRHGVPPLQVAYAFMAALLAVVILVGYLVVKLLFLPDNVVTPNNEILFILFLIGFCITSVAIFSIALIYKIRDIILETEFQNLIFASAGRLGTDFCLIINKDKNTVYCDYSFSQLFASFEDHESAFKTFLKAKGLKKADKDKILKGIKAGKSTKATFTHAKTAKAKPKKYSITIDPISRPDGYFVLKGIASK